MPSAETLAEARRSLEICNACRYCEGFCAVFPAMERRRAFSDGELEYLAHLCHNCRGCYFACQYAPPHPFNLTLPRVLAELRLEGVAERARPPALRRLFARNGLAAALGLAGAIAVVFLLTALFAGPEALFGVHPVRPGSYYEVIPHALLAWPVGLVALAALVAIGLGLIDFWRGCGTALRTPLRATGAALAALGDVLTLRNLGGGGHGCNDIDEAFSTTRRRLHHFLFYGFLLGILATTLAWIESLLGHPTPYPFLSAPVLAGTASGVAMLIGAGGMLWLHLAADPAPSAPAQLAPDLAMLGLLAAAAASGLLLLALRATSAMGTMLAIHLGCVLALFALAPYSRLAHGLYRAAALWRNALEARAGKGR